MGTSVVGGVCEITSEGGGIVLSFLTATATATAGFGVGAILAAIVTVLATTCAAVSPIIKDELCYGYCDGDFDSFVDKVVNLNGGLVDTTNVTLRKKLEKEAYFMDLPTNEKEMMYGQVRILLLQGEALEKLDALTNSTTQISQKLELAHIISLYGRDITNIHNVIKKFGRLTRGKLGTIKNDTRVDIFLKAALDSTSGLETAIDNVFQMMIGNHFLKKESIYEALGQDFCKVETHEGLLVLLYESLTLHAVALRMRGQSITERLIQDFGQNVIQASISYVRHCGCSNGNEHLLKAIKAGHVNEVKILRHCPTVDINFIDAEGKTPLYYASRNNNLQIVKELLNDDRLDTNKVNSSCGAAPLFVASENGHESIVTALLSDKRVDPNKSNVNGSTALIVAAKNGYESIVQELLAQISVDPNIQTTDWKNTALTIAAIHQSNEVMKLLLRCPNVNTGIKNRYGKTALEYLEEDLISSMQGSSWLDHTCFNCSHASHRLLKAVKEGNASLVRSLIECPHVNINLTKTLSMASEEGNDDVIKELKLVDCRWSDWTMWTQCSKTCGDGTSQRERSQQFKSGGSGNLCKGSYTEEKMCNSACPGTNIACNLCLTGLKRWCLYVVCE